MTKTQKMTPEQIQESERKRTQVPTPIFNQPKPDIPPLGPEADQLDSIYGYSSKILGLIVQQIHRALYEAGADIPEHWGHLVNEAHEQELRNEEYRRSWPETKIQEKMESQSRLGLMVGDIEAGNIPDFQFNDPSGLEQARNRVGDLLGAIAEHRASTHEEEMSEADLKLWSMLPKGHKRFAIR